MEMINKKCMCCLPFQQSRLNKQVRHFFLQLFFCCYPACYFYNISRNIISITSVASKQNTESGLFSSPFFYCYPSCRSYIQVMPQRTINPRNIICTFPSCGRTFSSKGGLTNHRRTHQTPQRDPPGDPPGELHPPTPPQDLEHGLNLDNDRPPSEIEEPNPNPRKSRELEKVEFHPYINGNAVSFSFSIQY